MFSAFKEMFKKTSVTAIKAATTRTEAFMNASKRGTEATMKASKRGTEAAMNASKRGTEAAMRASKIGTETVMNASKRGTEAAMRASKIGTEAAMKASKIGTEAAMKALDKVMTERPVEKTATKLTKTVMKPANTESKPDQKGTSVSDTKQFSDLNETLHLVQKRIHELQNDVTHIRERLANPESNEIVGIPTDKNVEEDVYFEQKGSSNWTAAGTKHLSYTVTEADQHKRSDIKRNKYVEVWVVDGNGVTRIPINDSSDTSSEYLIQRIIQLLRRLMGYIDIESFIKYVKTLRKNKHVIAGRYITKICLDGMIPGSKVVLDVADGIYHIYKGNNVAGVMYLFVAGIGAYGFSHQDFDAQPVATVEVGATQSLSISVMNVDTLITIQNVDTLITAQNVDTLITAQNVDSLITAQNVETLTSTVNVETPTSPLNGETPLSNVEVKPEYAIFVATTPKDDENS